MLVRRRAVEQVGGVDESFFMFNEESDWQYRMRDAGWEVVFFPGAEVVHVGGDATKRDWGRMFTTQVRSHVRFVRKHEGAAPAALTRVLLVVALTAPRPAVPRRARAELPAGGARPAAAVIELYLRLAGATLLLLAPGALLARSASGARRDEPDADLRRDARRVRDRLVAHARPLAAARGGRWPRFPSGSGAGRCARPTRSGSRCSASACSPVSCCGTCSPSRPATRSSTSRACGSSSRSTSCSLDAVGEFVDGGLHPGYAFPLWHAFLALVAKIAGVDPADVVVHEAAVLAPLAFLVVYEAGAAVFRSRWLGVATLAATVGVTALASGSGGALRLLALPATAGGRLLLVPAALALVFIVPPRADARAARARRRRGARARGRAPDVRALPAARAGRLRRRARGARAVGAPHAPARRRGVHRRRRGVPGVALPRRAGHGVVHAVERAGAGEAARDRCAIPASSSSSRRTAST